VKVSFLMSVSSLLNEAMNITIRKLFRCCLVEPGEVARASGSCFKTRRLSPGKIDSREKEYDSGAGAFRIA